MNVGAPRTVEHILLNIGFVKGVTKTGTPYLMYSGQSWKRGIIRIFADENLLLRESHRFDDRYISIIASLEFRITRKNQRVVDVQMTDGNGYLVQLSNMDKLKISSGNIYHSNIFWNFRAATAICLFNEPTFELKEIEFNSHLGVSVSKLGCIVATYPDGSPKTCQTHGYKCPCRK